MFDAGAYIDAMRAVGAKLEPVQGEPDQNDPTGTFTILLPADAATHRNVNAIDAAFAPRRQADPFADGRVAEVLFQEESRKRFVTSVGRDLEAAVREVARLRRVADAVGEKGDQLDSRDDKATRAAALAYEMARDDYLVAVDHVLEMPIRRKRDLGLKAEFAVCFCYVGPARNKVFADIAAFCAPDIVGTLPIAPGLED